MTIAKRLPSGVLTLCLVACNNALMVGAEAGGAAGAAGSGEPSGAGDAPGEGGATLATGGATQRGGGGRQATGGETTRGEGGAELVTGGTTGHSEGGAELVTGGTTHGEGGAELVTGGTTHSAGGASSNASLPCDVVRTAGHRCVAAHSTVRALVSGYSGPLYQVCSGPSTPGPSSCQGTTTDIGAVDGYADAALQDRACAGSSCTITKIYDQSGHGNDLEPSPPGGNKVTPGNPAKAADLPVTVNGHKAYGIQFKPGMGYRAGCSTCNSRVGNGTARGDEPESVYMVSSQKDLVNGCCFDYGNAETTSNDDGNGTVEAVYFGTGVIWGSGFGEGPWVMADLENGLFAGWENSQDQQISTNTPLGYDFVTAVLVGDTADKNGGKGRFALYGGDATSGALMTMYDGIRPEKPGYVPAQKQGSIVLSIAGDNSDADGGRFYEGAMISGAASTETVDILQGAIVAAGYGK
jgi:non-reducing end alpha-L-arabinofuranosidase